jgi:molecular chaperone GrpE
MNDIQENEAERIETESGEDAPRERTDAETELAQVKDQLLRALADAENGRRRAEREAADFKVYAVEKFARDVLVVADNLGRALESADGGAGGEGALQTLLEGVRMTEMALADVLSRHGVRRVGVKGDRFDPNRHQVVAQIPSDAPQGCIADVLQPGYVLGERTLRAAMVTVSLGGQNGAEKSGGVDVSV